MAGQNLKRRLKNYAINSNAIIFLEYLQFFKFITLTPNHFLMLLTRVRNRFQVDNDPEGKKIIKSVLDIINPPTNQPAEGREDAPEQFNAGSTPSNLPKIVLHIDDDREDREFVYDTIKSIDPSYILHEAKSGRDALDFLNTAKSAGNLPCLIILDLNMPGMNGFDTYNEIKKDDILKAIPTVIFTTAAVFKGNESKGNEHLPIFIKPDNFKDFAVAIRKILTHCKE
jgi:CheY-like chemotaxis protein